MNGLNLKCAKCGSDFEEGFIPDFSHRDAQPSSWVKGPPEKSFWVKAKVKGKIRLQIKAYHCTKCGYIELFAK